jgi:isoleucyl-tRNA synthetase
MPFYAEYLFQRVRDEGDAESVHLMAWPTGSEVDLVVLGEMSLVREFVTLALEARQKANIKVRQPLPMLTINIGIEEQYAGIIKDEVNVKALSTDLNQGARAVLDTTITPELKIEGEVRELMRAIQDARKDKGLVPQDRIILVLDDAAKLLVDTMATEVVRTVGATDIRVELSPERFLVLGANEYRFDVVKAE